MTVDLSDETLARLQAEATRHGVSIDDVIAELAARLPAPKQPTGTAKRKLAFAGIGASTSGRTARDIDAMLAEGFGRD